MNLHSHYQPNADCLVSATNWWSLRGLHRLTIVLATLSWWQPAEIFVYSRRLAEADSFCRCRSYVVDVRQTFGGPVETLIRKVCFLHVIIITFPAPRVAVRSLLSLKSSAAKLRIFVAYSDFFCSRSISCFCWKRAWVMVLEMPRFI